MFLAMVIKGGVFTAYDLATLVQTLQGLVQATTDSVIMELHFILYHLLAIARSNVPVIHT